MRMPKHMESQGRSNVGGGAGFLKRSGLLGRLPDATVRALQQQIPRLPVGDDRAEEGDPLAGQDHMPGLAAFRLSDGKRMRVQIDVITAQPAKLAIAATGEE